MVVFILLAVPIVVTSTIGVEPTSMRSVFTSCTCIYHVCSIHVISPLAQSYLLFLRRGASSHALFDGLACLPVSIYTVLSGYMYVLLSTHTILHPEDRSMGTKYFRERQNEDVHKGP